jgi:hypothetical protein
MSFFANEINKREHTLWVEKYRPNTIDGYVFKDDHQKKQIESWIEQPGWRVVLSW